VREHFIGVSTFKLPKFIACFTWVQEGYNVWLPLCNLDVFIFINSLLEIMRKTFVNLFVKDNLLPTIENLEVFYCGQSRKLKLTESNRLIFILS
jgi:hypothetical protein